MVAPLFGVAPSPPVGFPDRRRAILVIPVPLNRDSRAEPRPINQIGYYQLPACLNAMALRSEDVMRKQQEPLAPRGEYPAATGRVAGCVGGARLQALRRPSVRGAA